MHEIINKIYFILVFLQSVLKPAVYVRATQL